MNMIFETPSKTCPLRKRNGQLVRVIDTYPVKKKVKRLGRKVNPLIVEFADGFSTIRVLALPDELFVVPNDCDRCKTMASCKTTGYECVVTGQAP